MIISMSYSEDIEDENITVVAEEPEGQSGTEDEIFYISEESEIEEPLETKSTEEEASKIGQVDVSSLKDDLDFLG